MDRIAGLSDTERGRLFREAAAVKGMTPDVVEKDFWVCHTLKGLFSSEHLAPRLLFKGGTSLSKVFGLIHRFSEDIDLILDWSLLTEEDPYAQRSNTRQLRLNQGILERSRQYLGSSFLSTVASVVGPVCTARVEEETPDIIHIEYPALFEPGYLRPDIQLEIGPLAQWIPNARYTIRPYVAEAFPEVFPEAECDVWAIKAERTFWEKATILHAEAHRDADKQLPARYSRHYYDLAMMADDVQTKTTALADLSLLASVIAFKKRFYPRAWARYELARPGSLKLLPAPCHEKALEDDYRQMNIMIYKEGPSFVELMQKLKQLESEINELGGGE